MGLYAAVRVDLTPEYIEFRLYSDTWCLDRGKWKTKFWMTTWRTEYQKPQ